MKTAINDVNIYNTEKKQFFFGDVALCGDKISEITYRQNSEKAGYDYIIPGLVDVHTHGRAGYDFAGASADGLKELCQSYAKAGTTTVFPSIASAPLEIICNSIDQIKACGCFDGIHLEGRYLNVKRRGAHDAHLLFPLNLDELEGLLVRMQPLPFHVTAAVELEGGEKFVKTIVAHGGTAAIGHSDATYAQAMEAVSWGVSAFTHTFNAMSPIHHRQPGCVTAALLSDAYAEFICDGVHLDPAIVKLSWKAKNRDKFVLVTDSMMAAGFGDGEFMLAGKKVLVKNSVAMTDDGAIAGSTLSLFDAVINLTRFAGITLEEAIPCATVNPAKMVGIDGMAGMITEGRRADLCIVAPDKQTLKGVYARGINV